MGFPSPASATTVRDRILFTAADLFYREGVRAVGIDRIIASAETAKAKAELEYDRYRARIDMQPRPVDTAFEQAVKKLEKLPRRKRPKPPNP